MGPLQILRPDLSCAILTILLNRTTGPGKTFSQKNVGIDIAVALIEAFVCDEKVVCY